jgi:hypothetical protein
VKQKSGASADFLGDRLVQATLAPAVLHSDNNLGALASAIGRINTRQGADRHAAFFRESEVA